MTITPGGTILRCVSQVPHRVCSGMGPQLPTTIASSIASCLFLVSFPQPLCLLGLPPKLTIHIQIFVLRSALKGAQAKTAPLAITGQLRILPVRSRPLANLGLYLARGTMIMALLGIQGPRKILVG